MNTNQIGSLAELKVIEYCLKNNIQVFLPFGDGNTVDMILIVNGQTLKAQVKSTETGKENGVMTFNVCSSKSTRTNGERHKYTDKEIDIFLLYSFVYDEIYVVPINKAPSTTIMLRHEIPNKVLSTMHFTKDYSFDTIFGLVV